MSLQSVLIVTIFFSVPSNSQKLHDINSSQIKLELLNNVYEHWMHPGTLTQNWEYLEINNETVLISLTKSELELSCEAAFPIQWNLTGYIVSFVIIG